MTLQEVRTGRVPEISRQLADLSYTSIYSEVGRNTEKPYGNIIAARTKLRSCSAASFGFPWPQLVAHAKVELEPCPINVVTVHVPNGARNGWRKIETLEALRQLLLSLNGRPVILTGDFNEPQWEPLQDGKIITWGQERSAGRWACWSSWKRGDVSGSGQRWDSAVRWYFEGGVTRSAYWDVAGNGAMEPSHLSRGLPRWFDHVFLSEHFGVDACEYQHSFRTEGHSDHSALLAGLTLVSGEAIGRKKLRGRRYGQSTSAGR